MCRSSRRQAATGDGQQATGDRRQPTAAATMEINMSVSATHIVCMYGVESATGLGPCPAPTISYRQLKRLITRRHLGEIKPKAKSRKNIQLSN